MIAHGPAEDGHRFHLGNARFCCVLCATPEGRVEPLHCGAPLRAPLAVEPPLWRVERAATPEMAGHPLLHPAEIPSEYPAGGGADVRWGALRAVDSRGLGIPELRYQGFSESEGVPGLGVLPTARGDGARTLTLHLADAVSGLEADLHYTVWPGHAVLARSVALRNGGEAPIRLRRALSIALDLPPGTYDLQHLHGTWAQECTVERVALPHARFVVESTRGTASAAHMPYLAVLERDATETSGRAWAATLLWSGSHMHSAERGEFGGVRLLAGMHPEGWEWCLEPGGVFHTPQALLAISGSGLEGLGHAFHAFARDHVLPKANRAAPRPTYLNTWEAAYFNIDQARVERLADRAASLGAQMLVLDDGWFRGRVDDRRALGDWEADPGRFADGVAALAKRVRAPGLRFGLWVEPEMVSPSSELFRAHPDWVLHDPARAPSPARHQLVLDLGREEVRSYLWSQLEPLLAKVDYCKWDMNRVQTEVASGALPPERQGEAAHRHMLGVYALLRRVREAFPNLLLEACASGGNRLDYGMLRFADQAWLSDGVDSEARSQTLLGASQLFPADCLASYIGPSPNHQVGRTSSLETRAAVGALYAARGVSLGLEDLGAHEGELRAFFAWCRSSAPHMLGGTFHRLADDGTTRAWQLTSGDGAHVFVVDFHRLAQSNAPQRRLRLRGLDAAADYQLLPNPFGRDDPRARRVFAGDALMRHGFRLAHNTALGAGESVPTTRGDFQGRLLQWRRA